jgi:multiple sugar transport system ATP-binding protein
MAGIRLDALTKRYDSAAVVDRVTLSVEDGEFCVLVGPSGCGKTTVLRMIAGLEEPTEGQVFIGERDVTWVAPRDRDVAMVFQNYALYPHLSVRENIGFALVMRRMARDAIARKVRDAADLLSIGELLDRRPAQLSGGQRQRVALARAIVREPRCFLFDEPLSNLDAQIRAQTRAELVRLHRQLGATMLYVTHDQVEAMTMASRVAVMQGGRLQQVASPLDLYRRPATRFVAGFIGTPPINQFDGRVVAGEFSGALTARVGVGHLAHAVLAVRPEHLLVVRGTGNAGTEATVVLVEPLGPETHVRVRLGGGEEAIARVGGDAVFTVGESVRLRVAEESALVYRADDGTLVA